MDYTIYFENKTNATAAAQEVFVDLPMDSNLDWSTLELGEIVFGEHIDTSITGKSPAKKAKLLASYPMPGTNTFVKTTVTMKDGVLSWYMRDWDPTTADNFPASATGGFLPPNDSETHCGEGHLSFRVRVKSDAPNGAVINASAQIVFDQNPMIETDPSWWNTVGEDKPIANFTASEVEAAEGDVVAVSISGGNADDASSVDVYLTYNTAAAADVDLKLAAVSDGEAAVSSKPPYQTNLKFPLTLRWEKGEVGEKVITIPVKQDTAVEGDEFFTLQLANAVGVELGDERACTVTIRDANGYATLQDGLTNPNVKASTSGAGKWFAESGSSFDKEGLAGLYHVESPALAQGKSSTLAVGPVKGQGTFSFFIRFTGDPEEAEPSRVEVFLDKQSLGVIDHTQVTNSWESYVITIRGGSYTASHTLAFEFTQGSDPDAHAEITQTTWDYLGNISESTFYELYACPSDPRGGYAGGSGFYTYGETFKLSAKAFPGWSFDGWYEPYEDEDTGETEYFLWTKSASASYMIDRDCAVVAFFSKIPYVRALADPANAGKVTGSGLCADGKKVTLKATANKGFVFVGWLDQSTAIDGDRLLPNAIDYIATTPTLVIDRSAKPAKSTATSTTITNVTGDATYYACFITAEEDKAAIELAVDGVEMRRVEDNAPYQTNVFCGVYLEWPVAASALSETTVKVAGLPSGLKFTAKDIVDSKTKQVTVPASTVYGVPTAASKVDAKTQEVKPSEVKVTVTTAGKSSQTYQINTIVNALPAWAQGTYNGGFIETALPDDGSPLPAASGTVSLTIDAKGKISGKALGDGLTYTLAAPYYSSFVLDENQASNFLAGVTASWSYKEGSKTIKANEVVQLVVQDNGIGGVAAGGPQSSAAAAAGDSRPPELVAWQYNWKVEPWKALGKNFDKQTMAYAIMADGSFSESEEDLASALGADVVGRVTLKFSASGTATVSGEFVTGYNKTTKKYTTVKASGSATLVPVDEKGGAVFIYLTPKGLLPHARCIDVPWPQE